MFELRYLFKSLILPPCFQLVLLGLAVFCWLRGKRLAAKVYIFASISSLWVLSTPWISHRLIKFIESEPAIPQAELATIRADAIVILTGGQRRYAAEFGRSSTYTDGLLRAHYAAFVHKQTSLPILIAGGKTEIDAPRSLAATMALDLQDSFGVSVRWLEERSLNTYENARYSFEILSRENKRRIILVTSASHMRRAREMFEIVGFDVVSAPTAFSGLESGVVRRWLPSAYALKKSGDAIHELAGIGYYQLKSRLDL